MSTKPKTILDHAGPRSIRAALRALPREEFFLHRARTSGPSDKTGSRVGREKSASLASRTVCVDRTNAARTDYLDVS